MAAVVGQSSLKVHCETWRRVGTSVTLPLLGRWSDDTPTAVIISQAPGVSETELPVIQPTLADAILPVEQLLDTAA